MCNLLTISNRDNVRNKSAYLCTFLCVRVQEMRLEMLVALSLSFPSSSDNKPYV